MWVRREGRGGVEPAAVDLRGDVGDGPDVVAEVGARGRRHELHALGGDARRADLARDVRLPRVFREVEDARGGQET